MKTSTWVMIAGGVLAVIEFQPTLIPASIAGGYNASTGVGTGLLGVLNPIENKIPGGNVGLAIVAIGAIMRFGFGK